MRDRQDVERIGGGRAWDTVYRVPQTIEGEWMNAKEFAHYVFGLMEKAGYPYMSPELDDHDLPGLPPTIKVWDANQGMIRLIGFADDEVGAKEALQHGRDLIPTLENPEYYWPEAWWFSDGIHLGYPSDKIEGWDETSPIE
jgi:hypothetical protein